MSLLVELVMSEAANQNLIAESTKASIWSRHIVDSAQLLPLAPSDGVWVDVGSGAGFPGLVTAMLGSRETVLVEPRGRRVAFLKSAIEALGLTSSVTVRPNRIQTVQTRARVISARAVAPTSDLFASAAHCSNERTVWLLPKGRSAYDEIASAAASWRGTFHVEQSVTNPTSWIIVATGVTPR